MAILVLSLTSVTTFAKDKKPRSLREEVRRQLVTLPFYGVFDNLAYKIDGDTVTLYGSVIRPTTKTGAGQRISRIKGVQKVINNIEVLPLSRFDDDIRINTLRSISNRGSLYRYFLGANPSIHIVVNRGNVTLEGVVATRGDYNLANIAANEVFGSFSVTNNLQIENERR
ncbi:MAG: BON domain-containing protein [Pyrinomonadaceae bacterium]|nr:BON domain-containing protein [Pyrinomonadaceae bacterium]